MLNSAAPRYCSSVHIWIFFKLYENPFIHSLVMLVKDRQTKIPTEINIAFAARCRLWYRSTRLSYPTVPCARAWPVGHQLFHYKNRFQTSSRYRSALHGSWKIQTDNSAEYLTGLMRPANERRRYIVTTSPKPRISPFLTEHKTSSQLWDTLQAYIHQLPVFCFDHSTSLDMKLPFSPFLCTIYVINNRIL